MVKIPESEKPLEIADGGDSAGALVPAVRSSHPRQALITKTP